MRGVPLAPALAVVVSFAGGCRLYQDLGGVAPRDGGDQVDARDDADARHPAGVALCGQLLDVETGHRIDLGGGETGVLCDPQVASDDGPCSLQIRLYDMLQMYEGLDAPSLPSNTSLLHDTGSFCVTGVPWPNLGYMGLIVDDHPMAATDRYVPTAVGFPASDGASIDGLRAYAARRSTVEAWTSSAGGPFAGETFADTGAYLGLFSQAAFPAPAVVATVDYNPVPGRSYYFADPPGLRATVAPGSSQTGANGAALVVDTSLRQIGGAGGEPPACHWPVRLGGTIPGAIVVQEHIAAQDENDGECPPEA